MVLTRFFTMSTALIALSGLSYAGDGIVPVRQNGRVIFVNAEQSATTQTPTSATPTTAANTAAPELATCQNSAPQQYVYWSNAKRRWVRVPTPSKVAVRNACSAAQEVEAAMAAAPAKQDSATKNPNVTAQWTPTAVDGLIDDVSRRHSVDPNLVRAMIKVESNFNPRARSRKGAMGLMQLMPSTARELNVNNPYDPAQNLDGGIRHIKSLLEQNGGDVSLSLAAYNAGQGAVNRHGGVPRYKETQSYVKRITQMYAGNNALGGTYRSPIKVTRDSDGHRVYTND
jgi:soluble lytic murein transglycosylase-like protein